jgi:hypothetical protein
MGHFPRGYFFLLLNAPAILFLLAGLLANRNRAADGFTDEDR